MSGRPVRILKKQLIIELCLQVIPQVIVIIRHPHLGETGELIGRELDDELTEERQRICCSTGIKGIPGAMILRLRPVQVVREARQPAVILRQCLRPLPILLPGRGHGQLPFRPQRGIGHGLVKIQQYLARRRRITSAADVLCRHEHGARGAQASGKQASKFCMALVAAVRSPPASPARTVW